MREVGDEIDPKIYISPIFKVFFRHIQRGKALEPMVFYNDFDYYETEEKGHGRVETRSYWITDAIDFLPQKGEWRKINTIEMVESVRKENSKVRTPLFCFSV